MSIKAVNAKLNVNLIKLLKSKTHQPDRCICTAINSDGYILTLAYIKIFVFILSTCDAHKQIILFMQFQALVLESL